MAASEPSPVSDESSSEGSKLRLVNEAIPQSHDQPMTAMSPRLAILAETSLREHSAAEPSTTSLEPSRMRKRNSTSERRRIRERDLANASPSQRELVRLLIDQEQEASILRKQLYIANQRVDSEARRAAELERANQLATQRYHEINESRVVVQQEASKAIQDSRLYHLELENAQKEIERAQESLKHIERERDEAEAAAARARAKTRRLREQQIVAAARKEGRRLGFEAGFEHARQERLLIAARPRSTASKRNPRSSSRDVATRPYSPADSASKRNPRRDVVTTPNTPAVSASRRSLRSSSDVVTEPHFPPDQASRQDSIRNHNPQEEDEVTLGISSLLDDLETSPVMSVSDLPIRNLPPIIPSVISPAVSANPPRTPLRPFQPPPESTHESRSRTPTTPASPPPTIQEEDAPLHLANVSPSIQRYPIEIPPQEELSREEFEREYNTKENPNDIIKQIPPETWVTAAKHREMRGSPPAPYPGPQPPPLLPALYSQSKNVRPAKLPPKIVRFPSLAKTKQQAASWYRSLSFRKKNRPVIDPINEADESVLNPPISATSVKGKAPEHNSTSSQSDLDAQYVPPRPSQSWYKKSAPSSVHTTDARRRPTSGVESSPGLSQFELLFTPYVGTNSVRSGKEGKRLKEKDSQLSVIKEETPTNDRFLTDAMRASSSRMASSSIPHPNFIGIEQKGSYEALGSSSNPMKRRHPLGIVVPNPDEPLPPPGIAYSQPGPSNLKPQAYPISHKASQSSARTANTSIAIEVVPPSGVAPDPVRSPPHTGRNHLSPYHVFRPTSQPSSSRIIPMPSIKSLQSSGDKHLEPPPPLRFESRSGSRASSRHADNGGLGSVRPRSAASRPQSAMSAAPNSNPVVNKKSVEDARSSRSRTPRATQTHPKPESARSSTSKNQLSVLNLDTNQTNLGQQQTPRQQPSSSALNLVSPGHSTSRASLREMGSFANGFDALHPPVDGHGHPQSQTGSRQSPQQPSSSALNLVSPVRHSTSRVSLLREAGSFANGFDDGTYLDPAFYPSMSESNLNVPSRPVSRASSTLSYA